MDELKRLLELLAKAFEDYKKINDERIAEIAKKGVADPLLETKLSKCDERITELTNFKAKIEAELTKAGRVGGAGQDRESQSEHRKAFNSFLRKGQDSGLRDLETKTMGIATPADGGYLVPTELDKSILDLLKPVSPMRALCNVMTVGGANYEKLVNQHGTASGWVGETSARTETAGPSLAKLTPYMGEIYANPAATQQLLDDSFVDLESWLANEVTLEFAYQEGDAFVNGNGTNKPKGINQYTFASTDDGTRAFGQIQYVATGVSADWAASNKADVLLDLMAKFKSGMLQGAVWAARGSTITAIRKLKDGQGQYLWQPGLAMGQAPSLFGYAVEQIDALPAIGANSYSLALANWKRAYTIVDRIGVRVLRDPYTSKPYVFFYTTKRVGGFLADSEAIKYVKFGAS